MLPLSLCGAFVCLWFIFFLSADELAGGEVVGFAAAASEAGVVGGKDEAFLPLSYHRKKQVADGHCVRGVEIAGRLIGKDQARAVAKGPGDRHALPLSAREEFDRKIGPMSQPDSIEKIKPLFSRNGAAKNFRRHEYVFEGGESLEQIERLEDKPDRAPPHRCGIGANAKNPFDFESAAVGLFQGSENVEKSGFSLSRPAADGD